MKVVSGRYVRGLTLRLWVGGALFVSVALGYALVLHTKLTMVAVLGLGAVLVLLSIGLYRQLILYLGLLQIFTFAIKVGYGIVNTTLLALLPSAFLGLMVVQALLLVSKGKLHFRWTLLDLGVVAFFLLDALQVLNPNLNVLGDRRFLIIGLRGFQQRSFLALIYFVVRGLIRSEQRFDTIARVLAYSIALGGLYALAQQLFGFDVLEVRRLQAVTTGNPLAVALYATRSTGFLGSPFTFGMMSAMGMLCGLYVSTSTTISRYKRILAVVSVIINGMGVLFSGSRSTYLSLIVAMIVIVLWVPWNHLFGLVWKVRRTFLIAAVALTALIVLFHDSTFVQYSIERVATLGQLNRFLSSQDQVSDANFIARRELATETWPLIVDNPFGYGTGIFNGGSNPGGLVKVGGHSTWVDNEFSSLALELGVQGVLLLLAIVAMALWRCRRLSRTSHMRDSAVVLSALVIVGPAAGFGGQWLAAYPANVLFWTFVGVVAGLPLTASTKPRAYNFLNSDAGR